MSTNAGIFTQHYNEVPVLLDINRYYINCCKLQIQDVSKTMCEHQICKAGWAFWVGFGPKVHKISGLIRA